jgi:acetyltransferase-like isoleucine patch superfamily enzyme
LKKIVIQFIKIVNKILYPKHDIFNSTVSQRLIFKTAMIQKILGINRHVPWPVHWTSTIYAPENINPGSRTPGLGKNSHIDGRNGIIFGDNVCIGPNVTIVSMNHDVNNYSNFIKTSPIIVKDNCWIGAGVIILPGVEIGEHTVVAAGAVVTKSFTNGNQIIGGTPAKVIKKLQNYEV